MTETFHIVPGNARALWIIVALTAALMVGVTLLLARSARAARTAEFELSPTGLRLRGDAYGRLIPAAELRGDAARIVDLRASRELAPARRTMGTAIPGFRSGWFRLRDGEKALLYVTDPTRVVYVPTTAGYAVLLSVQQPERFLARLRAVARAGETSGPAGAA